MSWFKQVISAIVFVHLTLAQPIQDFPGSDKGDPVQSEISAKLLHAKRIYVDSFGNEPINRTLQSMVIDSLRISKRFIVTENRDKADLILKGSALEQESQEIHSANSSTVVAGRTGTFGEVMGMGDSETSTETINDAKLTVRLVSSNGDVVWSATEESKGGKYKGATADVADLVVKALLRELDRMKAAPAH
jgi:hypothetical protein